VQIGVKRILAEHGLALIEAVEREALRLGRTLIVLDTREGNIAESVYQRAGYTVVGRIPGYALDKDGVPVGTVIYYRLLQVES
jgi:acetyltransferase